LPPAGRSLHARALASVLDAVLLILDAQRPSFPMVQQIKEHLERHGSRLMGVILNKA
jgi:Mrp family chromosome partitioning ATPase